jgi:hypothetical protein
MAGTIYDAMNGEPIFNSSVEIFGYDGFYTFIPAPDGHFYVEGIPEGWYDMVARAPNFEENWEYGIWIEGNTVNYVDFWLYPFMEFGAVEGYVIDDTTGLGIPNAVVWADNEMDWADLFMTDSLGYYSGDLPPGMYNMISYANGYHVSDEEFVEIFPDSVVEVSFELDPAVIQGAIEGIVFNAMDENPLPWVYIEVYSEDANYAGYAFSNDGGFYHIPVPNGNYDLFAFAEEFLPFWAEDIIVSNGTVIFNIPLLPKWAVIPPYLIDVGDVPNDQGRQVRLIWEPGFGGDMGPYYQYSIWRQVNGTDLWDYIDVVPNHGMELYSYVAPTLGDSTADGIYWSNFIVSGHLWDGGFVDSEPMSGYSVDNLAPFAPELLAAEPGGGTVMLTWTGPVDEDFQYFSVYRKYEGDADFVKIGNTVDTLFVDEELVPGNYVYRVTAFDFNGNESEPSNELDVVIVGVVNVDNTIPGEYALYQNYPNPFNPETTIRFDVPEAGQVKISIYNITGQLVTELINANFTPGTYNIVWNGTNSLGKQVPSGVYWYRMQGEDWTAARKMVLIR